MAEKRIVYIDDIFDTPVFRELDPLPTLQDTRNAINYARAILKNYRPWGEVLLDIEGKSVHGWVYKIKTGEGESILAICNGLMAELDEDANVIKTRPFTFFCERINE